MTHPVQGILIILNEFVKLNIDLVTIQLYSLLVYIGGFLRLYSVFTMDASFSSSPFLGSVPTRAAFTGDAFSCFTAFFQ
jgi:uncharacterized membrane protein